MSVSLSLSLATRYPIYTENFRYGAAKLGHVVMKNLLKVLAKIKIREFRLNADQTATISSQNVPNYFEYNRVPGTIDELVRWKASGLLYCSIVVLKNVVSDSVYNHIIKLLISIQILCDKRMCIKFGKDAERLLIEFIFELSSIYGQAHLTYNAHPLSLIHLSNDVLMYVPLITLVRSNMRHININ